MENLNFELKKVFKYLLVFIFIISVFFAVKIFGEIKSYSYIGSQFYPQNVITVSGKGEVFAVPDISTFSFTFSQDAVNVSDAQNKNATKINSALEMIKGNGVEEKDIKTSQYNINPKYEYFYNQPCGARGCPPANSKITGYEVSQTISVKVRKSEKIGEILSKLGELSPSFVSGIAFEVDDIEKLKAEARKLAIEDAKEKAEILSRDLGVKLAKIMNFSEADGGFYPPYGIGGDSMVAVKEASVAPQIPVGENKIVSQIYLTYEIRD